MRVVEHLSYDFTGSFSRGTRSIPAGSYTISDVSVSEHGQTLTTVGVPYHLQWLFRAEDERRTFDVAYTVQPAVAAGPDVAELYWKWVGDDHPTIHRGTVNLTVPPGSGLVRAWGHGPLNGRVVVSAASVKWKAREVPDGTFVEGRVAMPTSRFPALVASGRPRLPTILGEERASIASAHAAVLEARDDAQTKRDRRDTLQWLAPRVALLGALGFWWAWRRWGREPPVPDDIGKYYRDLPDDPPAVVDAMMHWSDVRANAFGATVLDLVQRGYLTGTESRVDRGVRPDHIEYEFSLAESARGHGDEGVVAPDPRVSKDDEYQGFDLNDELWTPARELLYFERVTLEQVFATGSTVTQTELIKTSKQHKEASTERWRTFETSIERSLRDRGYLQREGPLPYAVNVALASVVALVGIGALTLEAWVGGAIAIAWAAVQFAHGLVAHLPAALIDSFATWYGSDSSGGPAYGSIGHFSADFASGGQCSFAMPSSRGGDGGFSGGGGHGGGGGGIGAH